MARINEHLYQAQIYDASNNALGIYDDFVSFYYKKTCNHIGMAIITVPEGHPIIANLTDDLLLENWISYPRATGSGIDWRSDFLGLYRDKQIATDENGNIYYLLYFPSAEDALARNVIAYAAGVNNKTQWVGADLAHIANDIVRWNCTAVATVANSRIRNANVVRNLLDAGGIAGTPSVNFSAPHKNVLEMLQYLGPICGFDFEVIRNLANLARLECRQRAGQLGTDRSADMIFDIALDNMRQVNLNGDRLREKTVAIVGGQGDGAARTFTVRTGVNQSATNDYEIFVDARTNTSTELTTIGDAKMADLTAKQILNAEIFESIGYRYKRDYGLGDLVTARLSGTSQRKKINSIEVKFDQDQESNVRVELIDW